MSNDLFGKKVLRRKKKVYSGSPQDPNEFESGEEKREINQKKISVTLERETTTSVFLNAIKIPSRT